MNESLLGTDGWWDRLTDVTTPKGLGAIGYGPNVGWIYDLRTSVDRRAEGDMVLSVEENEEGRLENFVRDVAGPASLAQVMRLEKELDELRSALQEIGEAITDKLS